MKASRRRVRLLTACFGLMTGLMIAYFGYSVSFYGGRWIASPHNPRISSQKKSVVMGAVTDRDGAMLAWTNEAGERHYNPDRATRMAVSQVVGDSEGKVSTGVDTFHAQYLLGFKAGLFERLSDALSGETLHGDDLELTVSERLSRYITEQFPRGKRGAAVVMNWRSGEILSMVSLPQFDPENMDAALSDDTAGALMNRCTQGLYPPGSTFKIVTLASALENLSGADSMTFDCSGRYSVGGYSVTEQSAHGRQTLSEAFSHSCNTAFASLSQKLGYEGLGSTAEALRFNENFLFDDLIVYNSSYPIDNLSAEDLAWSSIGQGRVLATPLHMTLIACAVANGGQMPEPRLISRILTPHGTERALPAGKGAVSVMPRSVADRVEAEMIRVVERGTGSRAALSGYVVAGKTGTAEASNDKSIAAHAWFVGYITNPSAPYAVCVLVENGGSGGSVAAPLARRILKKTVDLKL